VTPALNSAAYTYVLLRDATQNFSETCLISSEGAFGAVYRAQLNPSFIVAVKVMTDASATNEHNRQQFHNEIKILQTCRHPHLLPLLGSCVDGPQPILVYEYKLRGSLRDMLTHRPQELDWKRRLVMLKQIVSGLEFLHTVMKPLIIHRDVKTANILVDGDMNCSLGDFGIARLSPEANARVGVGASTTIMGTPGYIDPEYVQSGEDHARRDEMRVVSAVLCLPCILLCPDIHLLCYRCSQSI
jgi:serine/threonine protein kinase